MNPLFAGLADTFSDTFDSGEVTWIPTGFDGDPIPVRGIFNAAGAIVQLQGMDSTVETVMPTLSVNGNETPGLRRGDVFGVGTDNYSVVGMKPDRRGMINLTLEKRS